jgi:hypothetical protein
LAPRYCGNKPACRLIVPSGGSDSHLSGSIIEYEFTKYPGQFLKETVRPLQEKEQTVYVVAGSDAEEYGLPCRTSRNPNSANPDDADQ